VHHHHHHESTAAAPESVEKTEDEVPSAVIAPQNEPATAPVERIEEAPVSTLPLNESAIVTDTSMVLSENDSESEFDISRLSSNSSDDDDDVDADGGDRKPLAAISAVLEASPETVALTAAEAVSESESAQQSIIAALKAARGVSVAAVAAETPRVSVVESVGVKPDDDLPLPLSPHHHQHDGVKSEVLVKPDDDLPPLSPHHRKTTSDATPPESNINVDDDLPPLSPHHRKTTSDATPPGSNNKNAAAADDDLPPLLPHHHHHHHHGGGVQSEVLVKPADDLPPLSPHHHHKTTSDATPLASNTDADDLPPPLLPHHHQHQSASTAPPANNTPADDDDLPPLSPHYTASAMLPHKLPPLLGQSRRKAADFNDDVPGLLPVEHHHHHHREHAPALTPAGNPAALEAASVRPVNALANDGNDAFSRATIGDRHPPADNNAVAHTLDSGSDLAKSLPEDPVTPTPSLAPRRRDNTAAPASSGLSSLSDLPSLAPKSSAKNHKHQTHQLPHALALSTIAAVPASPVCRSFYFI
jgi:hypothetical protein